MPVLPKHTVTFILALGSRAGLGRTGAWPPGTAPPSGDVGRTRRCPTRASGTGTHSCSPAAPREAEGGNAGSETRGRGNHVVWTSVLLCFILAWCSYKGPQCGNRTARSIKSSRASLLPAPVTKETSAGLPPGSRDPAALSQSQAMTTWGSGRFVLLASVAGYAQLGFHLSLAQSAFACVCLKTTVLICTTEGRAACWAAV